MKGEFADKDVAETMRTMVEPAHVNHVPTMTGGTQIVDEMIFSFTHTVQMDWMMPGVAPTGKRVEIPLVAIIGFKDGKVQHEHTSPHHRRERHRGACSRPRTCG